MASPILLSAAGRLLLGEESGRTRLDLPLGSDPAARVAEFDSSSPLLAPLLDAIAAQVGNDPIAVVDPRLIARLGRLQPRCHPLAGEARSRARERLWPKIGPSEREFYLDLARTRLAVRLSSPEETLITLAREEERVERALRRETEAGKAVVTGSSESLRAYATAANEFQARGRIHLATLQRMLEEHARSMMPNLAELVGPRVAARLLTQAGGLDRLARMPGGRIQLLGARRRPSGARGPRFGLLVQADQMGRVPPARQGAYARSLASMAAIAARADAITHRRVVPQLLRRRDRRVESLRGKAGAAA